MDTLVCPVCESSSIYSHTGVYVICDSCGEESYIAIEDCRESAEKGDRIAQSILGAHYFGEEEEPENHELALQWLTKSLEQGYPPAYRHFGYMYLEGLGVERDIRKCHAYYMAGAEKDDLYCIYNTGIVYLRHTDDHAAAIPYLRKAAERGLTEAQTQLAQCYYRGMGIERDHRQTLAWAEPAARNGSPLAQFYLGLLHEEGAVVELDMEQALHWYEQAAEGGEHRAMSRMAYYYGEGEYVEKDLDKSFALNLAAAEKGDLDAQCNLAWYYEAGIGCAPDPEEAFYWYKTAAENGFNRGMYLTGGCYMEGTGVETDLYEAARWFALAVENGYDDAQKQLDWVSEQLALQEEEEDAAPAKKGLGFLKKLWPSK